MRSASRLGEHDLGQNARRIRAFLADLDAILRPETPPRSRRRGSEPVRLRSLVAAEARIYRRAGSGRKGIHHDAGDRIEQAIGGRVCARRGRGPHRGAGRLRRARQPDPLGLGEDQRAVLAGADDPADGRRASDRGRLRRAARRGDVLLYLAEGAWACRSSPARRRAFSLHARPDGRLSHRLPPGGGARRLAGRSAASTAAPSSCSARCSSATRSSSCSASAGWRRSRSCRTAPAASAPRRR